MQKFHKTQFGTIKWQSYSVCCINLQGFSQGHWWRQANGITRHIKPYELGVARGQGFYSSIKNMSHQNKSKRIKKKKKNRNKQKNDTQNARQKSVSEGLVYFFILWIKSNTGKLMQEEIDKILASKYSFDGKLWPKFYGTFHASCMVGELGKFHSLASVHCTKPQVLPTFLLTKQGNFEGISTHLLMGMPFTVISTKPSDRGVRCTP